MNQLTATAQTPIRLGRWDSEHRLGQATSDLAAARGGLPFPSVALACRYRLAA